jgi:hypothetical protein
METGMSTRKNPNKIVYDEPVDEQFLQITGKQVELAAGGTIDTLHVLSGNLKLCGYLEIGQVIVVDPTDGDGTPDNGLYLSGASGWIGSITTAGCVRDQGKIGSDAHDLVIGTWIGRCWPPTEFSDTGEPVHRDGLQISKAQRVSIGYFGYQNPYRGATNGGIWINPQKSGEDADPTNPDLCVDIVVDGGRIINPNAAIHLGACTRCGARNTVLAGQRPLRTHDYTVDPVDEANTKIVLELS